MRREMVEGQSIERTCFLHLVLFRYGGVHTSYDRKAGLQRRFVLRGTIDHSYYDHPDYWVFRGKPEAFLRKRVRVDVISPIDPEWVEKVRDMRGVDQACGAISISTGVEPKRSEAGGEVVEWEPISVELAVDADAFEALRRQAADAYGNRRIMTAKVTLAGNSLPEPKRPTFLPSLSGSIDLAELDVSADQEHAIRDFEMFDTDEFNMYQGRVLPVERKLSRFHQLDQRITGVIPFPY